MNLKRFNTETLSAMGGGKSSPQLPLIRINTKGYFNFSKFLAEKIGLVDGCKVEILQNEEAKSEWFIVVSKSDVGFPVRIKNGSAVLQKAAITSLIFASIVTPLTSLSMRVGIVPVELNDEKLYPIPTNSYKDFIKKA